MIAKVQHFTHAPNIQHFATVKVSENDNVYGVVWGEVVREYLKTAYAGEGTHADIVSDGVSYKVLKRGEVTAFYDADGNTLFDVENRRLEKEYGYVMKELDPEGRPGDKVPGKDAVLESPAGIKERAKAKLGDELKAARDKGLAEPVIGYLIKRCEESEGLAQDVMQGHKKWEKCVDYIYGKAKKQAKGSCIAIPDSMAFEWAEDYYHKDDKAEEQKKAKEAEERKAKTAEKKVKAPMGKPEGKGRQDQKAATAAAVKEPKTEPQPKRKKSGNDMEGQIDMFSMMGM